MGQALVGNRPATNVKAGGWSPGTTGCEGAGRSGGEGCSGAGSATRGRASAETAALEIQVANLTVLALLTERSLTPTDQPPLSGPGGILA